MDGWMVTAVARGQQINVVESLDWRGLKFWNDRFDAIHRGEKKAIEEARQAAK